MEQNEGMGGGATWWSGGIEEQYYWGAASLAQLGWAISSFRRGYAGDSRLMPIKAFGIASLFLGSVATATMGSLRASGIRSVDDMKALGENIRTSLGARPRSQKEESSGTD
ncbi:OLC1v1038587C3 [Oldenlandia corymbosa var. corymbosa]|uniref:OLC1v1038587C3 n=1 Tax=Oldenlandia corymbosa var. corymbosa TaxID=529605 RepID=A0AAV1D396_OLDCO|nr:OLC1v1038587C3 [Oldenlandia corymbosa var. corymbosa]